MLSSEHEQRTAVVATVLPYRDRLHVFRMTVNSISVLSYLWLSPNPLKNSERDIILLFLSLDFLEGEKNVLGEE